LKTSSVWVLKGKGGKKSI